MSDFTAIPTLDLSLLGDPDERKALQRLMLHVVRDVGMCYVTGLPFGQEVFGKAKVECEAFFNLPEQEKKKLDIGNVPGFLGYTAVGTEYTDSKIDTREHLTVAHPIPGEIEGPVYQNLWGPTQWPDPTILPEFTSSFKNYMEEVARVEKVLRDLMTEATGLNRDALNSLFDQTQQYRMRMIKYPGPPASTSAEDLQALGAHQDHTFVTLIYQVTDHVALQARNSKGDWIDCPPKPGSLVFVVGKSGQAATFGVCSAATHRVAALAPGSTDRYSISVGTNLRYDASVLLPSTKQALETIQRGVDARYPGIENELNGYLNPLGPLDTVGMKVLHNYGVSYPEIMERWHPELVQTAGTGNA
ncbi:hypothetical protein N7492_005590 [Penicillium capsulatum]|uniref:Fe2OG dioxygenase domain-containing protein n=1 Tax=Penicillium capsulatum TaxID=69766 RepID=A0A9W9IG15_9EURO|nr:hypothetical protein N7492_005590 [Penicillium capsulatum]KAJ6135311.1 hypothetical protein N7512_000471 [Penicillium capsulatum]